MQRAIQMITVTALLGLLGACGAGFGAAGPRAPMGGGVSSDAAPLTAEVIETQTLAPLPAPAPAPAADPLQAAGAAGRVIGAATAAGATAAPAAPAPTAQTAAEIGAAATSALQAGVLATTPAPQAAAPDPPAPAAAAPPASPEEAACRKEGGRWGRAGDTLAMTCFRTSKDAGKSCSKESDCSSQCLARSRTCAPFWPIFGCTEVIQNNGAVVRLCLE